MDPINNNQPTNSSPIPQSPQGVVPTAQEPKPISKKSNFPILLVILVILIIIFGIAGFFVQQEKKETTDLAKDMKSPAVNNTIPSVEYNENEMSTPTKSPSLSVEEQEVEGIVIDENIEADFEDVDKDLLQL